MKKNTDLAQVINNCHVWWSNKLENECSPDMIDVIKVENEEFSDEKRWLTP